MPAPSRLFLQLVLTSQAPDNQQHASRERNPGPSIFGVGSLSAYDHYAKAKELSAIMRREGFSEAALAIEDAIAAGFTSGEILMALRWHIDRFVQSNPNCSDGLMRAARGLHARIDDALS